MKLFLPGNLDKTFGINMCSTAHHWTE